MLNINLKKFSCLYYNLYMHYIQPSGFVLVLYVNTALVHYIPYSACRGVLTILNVLAMFNTKVILYSIDNYIQVHALLGENEYNN